MTANRTNAPNSPWVALIVIGKLSGHGRRHWSGCPICCILKDIPEWCWSSPTHGCAIYASVNWVSIGSNVRRQTITWTSAHLLSIWPLGTNFIEIWIKIQNSSLKKMHLKTSSEKCRPFCPRGEGLSPKMPVGYKQGAMSQYQTRTEKKRTSLYPKSSDIMPFPLCPCPVICYSGRARSPYIIDLIHVNGWTICN